jgi:hypothetical protein
VGDEPAASDDRRDRPVVVRPPIEVVDPDALVPDANLVRPPPNRFTHELTRDEPFRYQDTDERPTGTLSKGTRVVLLIDGPTCRVVDGSGLYVAIDGAALRPLDHP